MTKVKYELQGHINRNVRLHKVETPEVPLMSLGLQ